MGLDGLTGVKLTYGEWDYYGNKSNEKTLFTHGSCSGAGVNYSYFSLGDGEYITTLKIYYVEEAGVMGLYFKTNRYDSKSFGTTSSYIISNGNYYSVKTKTFTYGYTTRFYGFIGEEHHDYTYPYEGLSEVLVNLGVIDYKLACVDYYKLMLPASFSWTRDSWVDYSSGYSSSSSSSSSSRSSSSSSSSRSSSYSYDDYSYDNDDDGEWYD